MKKRKICPKWLQEFQWLKYDLTEKQIKCKVCLDAYGYKPKPSQSFVHGGNNFQCSSQTRHQSGNDHIMAMNIIKQRRLCKTVACHVQEGKHVIEGSSKTQVFLTIPFTSVPCKRVFGTKTNSLKCPLVQLNVRCTFLMYPE